MIIKHCRQLAHDIMKEDDKWIYNVKNSEIRQIVEFKNNSEVYRRLSEVDDVATLTPEERYYYEADLKIARDTINQIRGAYLEGLAKGLAEAEGMAEERRHSINIMLSAGVPPEKIAESYRLTIEEVMDIAESGIDHK